MQIEDRNVQLQHIFSKLCISLSIHIGETGSPVMSGHYWVLIQDKHVPMLLPYGFHDNITTELDEVVILKIGQFY